MLFPVNQNLRKKVDGIGKGLIRSLLPPTCLLCDQPGAGDIDLCERCWLDLPANQICCPRCALPLATGATSCADCQRRSPVFTKAVAPMLYQAGIATLIPRFKFHHNLAVGRLLAEIFCRQSGSGSGDMPEALVPVPLHCARLRSRGFDQGLELAKIIARQKAIPLRSDLLQRQRHTTAQTHLNAVQRRKNCSGAFVVTGKNIPEHIALIDDVMTTGATVQECAKVLLDAGAKRVDIWVIARVP